MKKLLKSRKAVKPVVAAIILIAVTVAVSVAVAAWVGSLTIGYMDTKTGVDPQIYSANYNFGVLNEDAIFDIWIENCLNKSRVFNVIVSADEHEIFNETVEIMGLATRNLTINQKLLFSGLWRIAIIFEENKLLDGYSFVTLENNAEANLKINQNDNINFSKTLSIASLVISFFGFVFACVSFWYAKVRVKKDEKDRKKAKTD